MIRVLFIEDDAAERLLIQTQINLRPGLHCTSSPSWPAAYAALTKGLAAQVDVVLLDLGLPGPDGIVATSQLKKNWPSLKIVVFTYNEDPKKINEALEAGADGYLFKTTSADELAAALINHAGTPISPGVARQLVGNANRRKPFYAPLSPTQRELLEHLDRGQTYKQAAAEMGISMSAAKNHAEQIKIKTLCSASISEAAWLRRQAA